MMTDASQFRFSGNCGIGLSEVADKKCHGHFSKFPLVFFFILLTELPNRNVKPSQALKHATSGGCPETGDVLRVCCPPD